jgi:hypothetical protein
MPEQGPNRIDPAAEGVARELEAANEEVMRLRELLVAKDAELGAAKGQLAELAGHSARLRVLLHRVNFRLPGLIARRIAQRLSGRG